MKIPKILDKKFYRGIDTLRALSVILVVIGHVCYGNGSELDKLHLGAIGVDIFFVISGFLITTLICKELACSRRFDLKAFFIRRAFRILPVVFLFSSLLFVIDCFYGLRISPNAYFSGLFFYKNLTDFSLCWENGHLWSLSVEEQFYIFFPTLFFYFGMKKYKKILLLLLIIIPVFNMIHYNDVVPRGLIHNIVALFANMFGLATYCILIGSIGALFLFKAAHKLEFLTNLKLKSIWTLVLLVLVVYSAFPEINLDLIPNFLYKIILGIGVLLIILLNLSNEHSSFFWDNPILIFYLQLKILKKILLLSPSQTILLGHY
jgi:peptidoglycan/LPS O-acetylase OafA/YrhL